MYLIIFFRPQCIKYDIELLSTFIFFEVYQSLLRGVIPICILLISLKVARAPRVAILPIHARHSPTHYSILRREVIGLANTTGVVGNVHRADENPIIENVTTSHSMYMNMLLVYNGCVKITVVYFWYRFCCNLCCLLIVRTSIVTVSLWYNGTCRWLSVRLQYPHC